MEIMDIFNILNVSSDTATTLSMLIGIPIAAIVIIGICIGIIFVVGAIVFFIFKLVVFLTVLFVCGYIVAQILTFFGIL